MWVRNKYPTNGSKPSPGCSVGGPRCPLPLQPTHRRNLIDCPKGMIKFAQLFFDHADRRVSLAAALALCPHAGAGNYVCDGTYAVRSNVAWIGVYSLEPPSAAWFM